MKVLMVKPGKEPQEMEITNDLHLLQQLVGGYIEVHPIDGVKGTVIICNEEGKLQGLPFNRPLKMIDPRTGRDRIYDLVHGDFLVVGDGGEDFCSLTDDQLKLLKGRFAMPKP